MSIWQTANGPNQIRPIEGTLWRLVEDQERLVTRGFVDDLDELQVLEEMLDDSKPAVPPGLAGLHYLLKTPFRYPPQEWGSRFGDTHAPSLLYGSKADDVTLWEGAFYRLHFFDAIEPPPPGLVRTTHCLFTATYAAERGIQLHSDAFETHRGPLEHPQQYGHTQQLGSEMRDAGVQAFEFRSARDPNGGLNVALFKPLTLTVQTPLSQEIVICDTSYDEVVFMRSDFRMTLTKMSRDDFLIDGVFPSPA